MSKKNKGAGKVALGIVKTYFPKVSKVTDARIPLEVEVTDADNRSAKVRNHNACAMAVACKRLTKADGIIISVKTAYVIRGIQAFRYKLPESVSREVVSFDRDAGFATGSYHLQPPRKSQRLGEAHGPDPDSSPKRNSGNLIKRFHHRTTGVRAALGSKHAPDGITR